MFRKIKNKIQQLAQNSKLNKQVIRQVKGKTIVYNIYTIEQDDDSLLWGVTKHDTPVYEFISSKIAVSWCLANHAQKLELCDQLKEVNRQLAAKTDNIKIAGHILVDRKVAAEQANVIIDRMYNDIARAAELKIEMEHLLDQTKSLTKIK